MDRRVRGFLLLAVAASSFGTVTAFGQVNLEPGQFSGPVRIGGRDILDATVNATTTTPGYGGSNGLVGTEWKALISRAPTIPTASRCRWERSIPGPATTSHTTWWRERCTRHPGSATKTSRRVKGARFARAQVEVETQFGSQQVDVKKPRYLCKPVDKNGEGIHGPSTRLMCYKLRAARPQVPDSVFTTNQFESKELEVFGARALRAGDRAALRARVVQGPTNVPVAWGRCRSSARWCRRRRAPLVDAERTARTTPRVPRIVTSAPSAPMKAGGQIRALPRSAATARCASRPLSP